MKEFKVGSTKTLRQSKRRVTEGRSSRGNQETLRPHTGDAHITKRGGRSRPLADSLTPVSALNGESAVIYPQSSELEGQPYDSTIEADAVCKTLSRGMKQEDDWARWFDALTKFRRLCLCHPSVVGPHLRSFISDLKDAVISLRSSLAKHGLMCFTDVFTCVGKYVERADFDVFLVPILKRVTESNEFLRQEASKAMRAMLSGTPWSVCLSCLLNNANVGGNNLKASNLAYLNELVHLRGQNLISSKDYGRTVKILCSFLVGTLPETRYHARKSILHLAKLTGLAPFERTCRTLLEPKHFIDLKKFLDKGLDQELSSVRKDTKGTQIKSRQRRVASEPTSGASASETS